MSATLDRMVCRHDPPMPTPASCTDCMAEGAFLPPQARRAHPNQAGVGGAALTNDCTVQAVAAVLQIGYLAAAEAMRGCGWTPGRGAAIETTRAALASHGATTTETGLTMAMAIADGGTFIVSGGRGKHRHCWTIRDGRHINAAGYDRPARTPLRYRVFRVAA